MASPLETYSFLGLPQSQWEFINSFAGWLAAIGTITAVVFSLVMARRAGRPKARLTCNLVFTIAAASPERHYVSMSIVNTGDRPIRITNIGWIIGFPRRRYAIQLAGGEAWLNSPIPVDLTHGQTASWLISTEDRYDNETWQESFTKKFVAGRYRWWNLFTLRAQAYTSTGHKFSAKPSSDLLKLLDETVGASS